MSREDLHFRLRIPAELKQSISDAADRNGRSMTAEIVHRLQSSLDGESGDLVGLLSKALAMATDAKNPPPAP